MTATRAPTTRSAWLLLAALGAAACGADSEPREGAAELVSLQVQGEGFADHEGVAVLAALRRRADGSRLETGQTTVAPAGTFSLPTWTLVRGMTYSLDLYLDIDGDELCAAPADLAWSETVSAGTHATPLWVYPPPTLDLDACTSVNEAFDTP